MLRYLVVLMLCLAVFIDTSTAQSTTAVTAAGSTATAGAGSTAAGSTAAAGTGTGSTAAAGTGTGSTAASGSTQTATETTTPKNAAGTPMTSLPLYLVAFFLMVLMWTA